ncbi:MULTISPECIES: xanthine dehydrogenase family protein subunit M [unclassified Pseudodesulfovibrio]|uniref:FAD binding domain-containing protein n=1 Tax=unclassified Pseudodesulfovibrio TaxID=2661612 RepID=UPI000FEBC3D7|nr:MULTISPECIES: xanthine dehydrogenase family protein subunit M [unclassified Pseudodesulfovibrio]MCJ2164728.1 xanthine dehydrogenase family protein subunit M [Pseudodesulfovibrio sp. S3-i]RWU04083.1 xanthine dehydrogenase family protein subunit M [Pseudodesulfovibrio sp. S3]
MKRFNHFDATSIEEAVSLLNDGEGPAYVMAGGSDLMGCLKDNLWMEAPERIVNLKTIPGLKDIHVEEDGLHVGALVTLTEAAESDTVKGQWPGLAEAARRTASPLLRNMGTIAGNICQENRCWYYRYPDKIGGRIDCVRKGGQKCLAVPGDHRYHSIFGAVNKCIAVNPSDTAPALIVLNATVKTSKRDIAIDAFFSAEMGAQSTVLGRDEIVTEIVVPLPEAGQVSAFRKIAYRKSIDFALVNCAASVSMTDGKVTAARICLNGVYNNPRRCEASEALLMGRELTEELAREAGEAAVTEAKPLLQNGFKVQMARTIVADTLMDCLK